MSQSDEFPVPVSEEIVVGFCRGFGGIPCFREVQLFRLAEHQRRIDPAKSERIAQHVLR